MAHKLSAKGHDIGGLVVKRILPNPAQKMVGPFIFFDHMGPGNFPKGEGINVRPHPHIGLSTLTYLFKGAIAHRDSLGNYCEIFPGDANWMTAGKGIVHSERESLEVRQSEHEIDGLQCWIALPPEKVEMEPAFAHVKKAELPHRIHEGVMQRLIVGDAYGMSAPVKAHSPMFYVDTVAQSGSDIPVPHPEMETGVYIIEGEIEIAGTVFHAHDFVILDSVDETIKVLSHARFVILGGETFAQKPILEWNFVAYNKERLQQARQDWRDGKFPKIPGDDLEFIPY